MTWQAAAIMVGGFVVAGFFSYRQHLRYARVINQVAAEENRAGVLLVTGRAKGWRRGAVVLLVVDRRQDSVTRALAMEGASVFARFRERPELNGPLGTLAERARSKAVAKAAAEALAMKSRLTAGHRTAA
ncbi:transcriptional regulator GutM [Amycolatopsis sp. YIM 10]|uniref:transcriptional regulator GutM n=1 Tax=Amycolatopsis sp. YIM 10 TaxID=2653857 RepID=UPI00128FFC10|nr:transcriptional regulator GutM [Amycolatopsis sp. YIM 10]QFU91774.1 Glucitol operon activator protein (GutM) [Amycolatopsis sp. YIM 10]